VVILSSQEVQAQPSDIMDFKMGLMQVCKGLAEDIVRNGEGTQHVIKIEIDGAPSDDFARDLGRFVCNSNLFKCAIAGCDPNVGRIVAAVGSYVGSFPNGQQYVHGMEIILGGTTIFKDNSFQLDPSKETVLSDYLFSAQLYPNDMEEHYRNYPIHSKSVEMQIKLKYGKGKAVVIGSDLTKEYVEINADYRS
jgi:glutamate N-acetyltransferase/amino-acid N-acetyltransferase